MALLLTSGGWVMLNRKGRTTAMADQRIAALDGLRGMAIAYVMLGHFGPDWLDGAGSLGVTMFFALSGRLMADVLFIEGMSWREFAVRRIARLYPALLFFLVCMFSFAAALGQTRLLADWWSYPIFAVNLVVIWGERFPPFDHLWSVSMEAQAYILLALIASGLSGRKRLITLMMGATLGFSNGLARSYIGHQNPFLVYWRPDVGTAVIFAAAFLRMTLKDVAFPAWFPTAAFATANFLMLSTSELWATATVNGLLLAFVGASAERSVAPMPKLLESLPLVFLGTISYSLYIWQQLFMYSHQAGFPLFGAVTMSMVVATFSYYRIEKPGKIAILSMWHRPAMIDKTASNRH